MTNKRLESLDILRGVALIFIILFHSSIYNFANIHQLDFDNPPIIIILMSFMALWGGVFIIYSMVANTLMVLKRDRENQGVRIFKYLSYASAIYLFLHYILNIFLGRWNTDFVNNQPEMSFVANAMRGLDASFPHISKFFEGSSLSTIALNLLISSWVLYLLLKNGGEERKKRN